MAFEQLLEDYNDLKLFEAIRELDGGAPTWRLRGVFSEANVANKNKRVYPIDIMRQVVESLQPIVAEGGFVGELDHPPSPKINMDKISHKITRLTITEAGKVVGEIVPAGPRKGDLISLLEDKIRCGVSTRGTGKVKPYMGPLGEDLVEVLPGYSMKAIDIVFDPSAGAFPSPVLEDIATKVMLGGSASFRKIWEDVFTK